MHTTAIRCVPENSRGEVVPDFNDIVGAKDVLCGEAKLTSLVTAAIRGIDRSMLPVLSAQDASRCRRLCRDMRRGPLNSL